MSEGVEGSGSTASEGVVAVLFLNGSSAADLGGWVEGVEGAVIAALEVGITGNLSASEGNSDGLSVDGEILAAFDLAASLSGWVIRGRATALEVVVAVADHSGVVGSTAAKLGRWVESAVSTALLSIIGSVGDDVEVDVNFGVLAVSAVSDSYGGAAQVTRGVVGPVATTALEVSVSVVQDVVGGAAELVGWIVSGGSAASLGAGDLLVVHRDNAVNSRAALLVVAQTVSTAA